MVVTAKASVAAPPPARARRAADAAWIGRGGAARWPTREAPTPAFATPVAAVTADSRAADAAGSRGTSNAARRAIDAEPAESLYEEEFVVVDERTDSGTEGSGASYEGSRRSRRWWWRRGPAPDARRPRRSCRRGSGHAASRRQNHRADPTAWATAEPTPSPLTPSPPPAPRPVRGAAREEEDGAQPRRAGGASGAGAIRRGVCAAPRKRAPSTRRARRRGAAARSSRRRGGVKPGMIFLLACPKIAACVRGSRGSRLARPALLEAARLPRAGYDGPQQRATSPRGLSTQRLR